MRVVNLANYGGSYAGSFVPMIRAISRAAGDRGIAREVVFDAAARDREWVAEIEHDGTPVRFGPPAGHRGEVARWVEALLTEDDEPTVLHTHFTAFDLPAVLAARRASTPAAVIWHVHTPLARGVIPFLRNAAKFGTAGRRVERILCVTPALRLDVVSRLAPRNRVEFLPNAIDADRFRPASDDERATARRELGLPPDAELLLHFGWDWVRKGGTLFLEAVADLRARGRPVLGVTVGGSREAKSECDRLGVDDAVIVHEPTGNVQLLYAAADVLAATSTHEGMPFALLESLARGTPVVATAIPGHDLVGTDLEACRLVAPAPNAVADAVERLLDAPQDVTARARATSRERIESKFDIRPWAERVVDIYEAL